MKTERFSTGLLASLLATFLAWGATGCFVSAFDLSLQYPATLVWVCAIAAAGTSVLLSFQGGSFLLLCIMALLAGYIYQDGKALEQLKGLMMQLSRMYNRAYGWGVLTFSGEPTQAEFIDWVLWIWGALVSVAVCCCVCRRKSVWIPVLSTVLPLCCCIVVTDTVPEESCLLTVMAVLILLLLTSPVRCQNNGQGNQLTLAAALSVVLALSGLFLAAPQESYVNPSAVLRENILTAIQNFPQLLENGMGELASGLRVQLPKQVDLAALGDRIPFTYPVMEVTAERSGTLYLRGQDYDLYDGFWWKSSDNRKESFASAPGRQETIHIRTRTGKQTKFLPYHPALVVDLVNGAAENPTREQAYTVLKSDLPENWRQRAYENAAESPVQWEQYLSLPETTRQGAAVFLKELYEEGASHTEKADMIAKLVTDSAQYDIRPDKMPAGESDFALWFLRDGDAGYCVHFATAAAVLLRAAGVPARYVTGYLLEAEAGKAVTVTEENAHAWAEYYEPNLGVWLPLECTPALVSLEEDRPLPEAAELTVSAETEPDRAEEVTETAMPTEPVFETAVSALPQKPDDKSDSGIKYLLFLPGAISFLMLQRRIRLAFRRRRRTSGCTNQQAIYRWQEAVRISRLLKETPTEELMALAQKAKFSQYGITQEELQQFDSFYRSCLRRLMAQPWYLRLIYRYICAVC